MFCFSCERSLMDYSGKEGIYFAVQWGDSWGGEATWPYMPYSNVEFIKIDGDRTTVNLKVMVTGETKEYDRTFSVVVNPDSTTAEAGVDYLALPEQIVIPADQYMAYVPLVVLRTAELQSQTLRIGLQLVPGSGLSLAFPEWDAVAGFNTGKVIPHFDASFHTVYLSDFLVKPGVWPGSTNPDGFETGMWGEFSRKKLELICELFNLKYSDFANSTVMPSALQTLIQNEVSKYLIECFDAGDPVLEDDGRLMFMSGCPWLSYPGVPWVPES